MASIVVFALLFILSFVILPFGATQFENPKVILAEGGILLLFLLQLFTNSIRFQFKNVFVLLLGILLLLSVVDIVFLQTNITFFGNVIRMQGVFLLWLLLLFSWLSSQIVVKRIHYLWYMLLLLIECVAIFFLPINESGRYVGTLGEPNALAAFAIFLWPFIFFGIKKFGKKEVVSIILSLVLMGIILFFSGSRSGLIAFGIEIVCVLFLKWKFSLTKILIICFCLYGLSYTLPFFQNTPHENRIEIWKAAVFAGSTHPLLGSGFGNAEIVLHNAAVRHGLEVQHSYIDSSHNIFLDFWVEGGIIGVGVLIALVILATQSFVNENNKRNLVLLLGVLTVLSFNPSSVSGLLGFWWLIGQGMKKFL